MPLIRVKGSVNEKIDNRLLDQYENKIKKLNDENKKLKNALEEVKKQKMNSKNIINIFS